MYLKMTNFVLINEVFIHHIYQMFYIGFSNVLSTKTLALCLLLESLKNELRFTKLFPVIIM